MTRSKDLNHFFKGLVTAGDEGGKWHDRAHRKHLNQGKIHTEWKHMDKIMNTNVLLYLILSKDRLTLQGVKLHPIQVPMWLNFSLWQPNPEN